MSERKLFSKPSKYEEVETARAEPVQNPTKRSVEVLAPRKNVQTSPPTVNVPAPNNPAPPVNSPAPPANVPAP